MSTACENTDVAGHNSKGVSTRIDRMDLADRFFLLITLFIFVLILGGIVLSYVW